MATFGTFRAPTAFISYSGPPTERPTVSQTCPLEQSSVEPGRIELSSPLYTESDEFANQGGKISRSVRFGVESNIVTDDALALQETQVGDAIQTNRQTPPTEPFNEIVHLTGQQALCDHSNHAACGCGGDEALSPHNPRQEFIAHFSRQFGLDGMVVVAVSRGPCDPTTALSYTNPSLSGRKFHECSTSSLAPGIWLTLGFCGSGFADSTSTGTPKRQYGDENLDPFNTTRKPRGIRKSVQVGGRAKEIYAAGSDGDVVELNCFDRSRARHCPSAADSSESDCTDTAKLTGVRQRRGWTGADEKCLQDCVERGMPWPKTAERLNRTEPAVVQHWKKMMGEEEERHRHRRKGRDGLPLGTDTHALGGSEKRRRVAKVAKPLGRRG